MLAVAYVFKEPRIRMDSDGVPTKRFCEHCACRIICAILTAWPSYFTDSRANLIYAYDYEDGNLTNRRLFVDAMALGLEENSYCDGLCVDTEGYVWSARSVTASRSASRPATGWSDTFSEAGGDPKSCGSPQRA